MSNSATQWTVACQPPLSVEFSRQEYWSGLHSLLRGIFLTQGLNPVSRAVGRFFTVWATREALFFLQSLSSFHFTKFLKLDTLNGLWALFNSFKYIFIFIIIQKRYGMDILNQLSNHLITEACHKMSALLAFFAIKFLPSATALMAPTSEKRTGVNGWQMMCLCRMTHSRQFRWRSGANGGSIQGNNGPSNAWGSRAVPYSWCKLRLSFSQTLLITVH